MCTFSDYNDFLKIYISQSSVATQLRRDGIFTSQLIANCQQTAPVKRFENLLKFGEDMDNEKVGSFSETQCINYLRLHII